VISSPEQAVVLLVGQVDHGKSSLLGRLLVEEGLATDQHLKRLASSPNFALLLDALGEERAEEKTVGLTRVTVHTQSRPLLFLDAPGHQELLRSLVTGLSIATALLIVVAADEGVTDTLRRQLELATLFPVRDAVLAITKSDLLREDPAEKILADVRELFRGQIRKVVSTSAATGAGIDTLISTLIETPNPAAQDLSFSMWVQGVRGDEIFGTPHAGSCIPGDRILASNGEYVEVQEVLPLSEGKVQRSLPVRIKGSASLARGMLLKSGQRVERLIELAAHTFEEMSLTAGEEYTLRVGTFASLGRVESVHEIQGLGWTERIVFKSNKPVPLDLDSVVSSRYLLENNGKPVAVADLITNLQS